MKSAAILTIIDAKGMTPNGRKQVSDWLHGQAEDLVVLGEKYSKKCTARFQDGELIRQQES